MFFIMIVIIIAFQRPKNKNIYRFVLKNEYCVPNLLVQNYEYFHVC